ncbi:hypothetical protein [Streptomyces sp. CS014]|nr:hypothetical protein [Streptomyces sp. CS014]
MQENTTTAAEFLTKVEKLREGEQTITATAHTSSVSADGWDTDEK